MGRHTDRKPIRETVALVGDGQTERIYFSDAKDTDRPENLTILPDYPRKLGSYKGVIDRAISLKQNGYDRVYALIDMDKILAENQTLAYRQAKADAEARGVIVLESNPCFEVWLLLHFVHTGRLFSNCSDVVTELRKHIPGYDKSEKFLAAASLYGNYKKQLIENAMINSRKLEVDRDLQSPQYPRAEVFRFFEWYFKSQGIKI